MASTFPGAAGWADVDEDVEVCAGCCAPETGCEVVDEAVGGTTDTGAESMVLVVVLSLFEKNNCDTI